MIASRRLGVSWPPAVRESPLCGHGVSATTSPTFTLVTRVTKRPSESAVVAIFYPGHLLKRLAETISKRDDEGPFSRGVSPSKIRRALTE